MFNGDVPKGTKHEGWKAPVQSAYINPNVTLLSGDQLNVRLSLAEKFAAKANGNGTPKKKKAR